MQTKQERSSDILQGQALFIRVEKEILFDFWTEDRETEKTVRQTEKTDIQKNQTGRNDR